VNPDTLINIDNLNDELIINNVTLVTFDNDDNDEFKIDNIITDNVTTDNVTTDNITTDNVTNDTTNNLVTFIDDNIFEKSENNENISDYVLKNSDTNVLNPIKDNLIGTTTNIDNVDDYDLNTSHTINYLKNVRFDDNLTFFENSYDGNIIFEVVLRNSKNYKLPYTITTKIQDNIIIPKELILNFTSRNISGFAKGILLDSFRETNNENNDNSIIDNEIDISVEKFFSNIELSDEINITDILFPINFVYKIKH
jgi:hypothetical protein